VRSKPASRCARLSASACASSLAIIATSCGFCTKPSRKCTRSPRTTPSVPTETFTPRQPEPQTQVNQSLTKVFTYDPIGNLLSKSDVGTYSYPLAGAARRHTPTGSLPAK
jgi:hypothetical protein